VLVGLRRSLAGNEAMSGRAGVGMTRRIVHVGVVADHRLEPEAMLREYFTLHQVAAAVAASAADVTVVQAAARDHELERDGVRYRFVRVPRPAWLRRRAGPWALPVSRRLVDAVRSAAPEVIHFHGLIFPRHVAALRRALPRAAILVQHHAEDPPGWRTRWLYRRGLAGADGVAFTAPEQAEAFLRAGVLPSRIAVFPIPESSSSFTPGDRDTARAATGVFGDPALVWLGNLDANKDPLTVLRGFAHAARELPDAHLWLAYRHRPLLGAVEALVAADPLLRERVHFLGTQPRARVELLLRAADFFVQGSHDEGSGYALIEALACGIPPVVTDIPAFRALTGAGRVGALFRPGDAPAMCAALAALATRERARREREVRRHFEDTLRFDVIGRGLVAAYDALCETRG
jgi:glycosyltransferase involved in cell wall biosynthesis